jgi:hypothetical protein
MANETSLEFFSQGAFNTLAQNGTTFPRLLKGSGADIKVVGKMCDWSKRKKITQFLMLACIDVAKQKGATKRVKQYWNTYHCMQHVTMNEGKIHGKYCKNKFCELCQAIRKAKEINLYYPILKNWKNAYFVTLTIKSVVKRNLIQFMRGMVKAFQRIKNKYRKRNTRGTDYNLVGIRSLECNFNPEKRTYNPHFHLIVQTKEMAENLIDDWLEIWTLKHAGPDSQDIKPIVNVEEKMMEVIKYSAKIFTDPQPSTKKYKRERRTVKIYASAFDNINAAMSGLRLFERFGFNLPKGATQKEPQFTMAFEPKEWKYDLTHSDWFCQDIEAGLSGFIPSHELEILLTQSMDILLE